MRNPLSAIMLCADGIANSLIEFQSLKAENKVISQSLVESNLDAAQTIVLCAQHQKRIIDDVLTLSKLNSAMLHVAPIQIQLESTVRRTLKMFEGELQADGIKMTFVLEPSYHESQIDWVFCDPVRLTQIFINLLTNVSTVYVFSAASTYFILGYQIYSRRKQTRDNGQPWSVDFEATERVSATHTMVPIKGL